MKSLGAGDDQSGVVGSCRLPPRPNCVCWPGKTAVFGLFWLKINNYVNLIGDKRTAATKVEGKNEQSRPLQSKKGRFVPQLLPPSLIFATRSGWAWLCGSRVSPPLLSVLLAAGGAPEWMNPLMRPATMLVFQIFNRLFTCSVGCRGWKLFNWKQEYFLSGFFDLTAFGLMQPVTDYADILTATCTFDNIPRQHLLRCLMMHNGHAPTSRATSCCQRPHPAAQSMVSPPASPTKTAQSPVDNGIAAMRTAAQARIPPAAMQRPAATMSSIRYRQ